jgi:hypothetical protein
VNCNLGASHQKLLEGTVVKGGRGREGREGVNSIASPSFGSPHAGLCHQGQGPKTVEATIHMKAFAHKMTEQWQHRIVAAVSWYCV